MINAKYIRDVGMDIAMEVLGNVFVTQIGVAFYVIKVIHCPLKLIQLENISIDFYLNYYSNYYKVSKSFQLETNPKVDRIFHTIHRSD